MSEIKIDTYKLTMPLITDEELMKVDNCLDQLVQEFIQTKIHDQDLLICQHIIEKLQKKISELKGKNKKLRIQVSSREEVANKYKEVIDEAREYVKNNYHLNWYAESCYKDDLLQILDKGADS